MMTSANMTFEDLKKLIEEMIDERLTQRLGAFEMNDAQESDDVLTWDDIRASAEQHRWTPPTDAKSSLAFLREDREG